MSQASIKRFMKETKQAAKALMANCGVLEVGCTAEGAPQGVFEAEDGKRYQTIEVDDIWMKFQLTPDAAKLPAAQAELVFHGSAWTDPVETLGTINKKGSKFTLVETEMVLYMDDLKDLLGAEKLDAYMMEFFGVTADGLGSKHGYVLT